MSDVLETAQPAGDAIYDEMSAAYDKVVGIGHNGGPELEPEEPAAEEPIDARPRDEHGRFAPKNAEKVEPSEAPAPDDTAQSVPEDAGKAAAPSISAPEAWAAPMREHWAKLPPDVQQYVAEREADAHKRITETGQFAARYRELDEVLAPHRARHAMAGMSDAQAVAALVAAAQFLEARPAEAIQHFARQYGVPLSVPGQEDQPAPQPVHDPRVARLEQSITAIQQADANRQIEEFSRDRPHFAAVRERMGRLMNAGLAETLGDAYDQAIRLDPTVSAKLEAEKIEAAKKAAVAEQRARVDAARPAALVAGARGTTQASKPPARTMDETLEEVASRFYN